MGLKDSFRSLPTSFKGLNLHLGRADADPKRNATKRTSDRAVFDITATTVVEEEAPTPPPLALNVPSAPDSAVERSPVQPHPGSTEQPVVAAEAARGVKAALQTAEASSSSKARASVEGSADAPQPRGTKSLGPADGDRPAILTTRRTEPAANPAPEYQLPPSIQLSRFLYSDKSLADSQPETPASTADTALVSEVSAGTVVVGEAHQSKLSLTLTASIEDYAKKADPGNWSKAVFRKSQFVRIQPGTYAVPYKKLSESRNQYTDLDAFTKGTIHQINRETDTRDPREFVADEGTVCYRVWIPRKVNSSVEFIFVEEHKMTLFRECTYCTAYATLQCSGCKKVWYCTEECQTDDWRVHKQDCKHKARAPPALVDVTQEGSGNGSDTPASSISSRPTLPGPRRKFMDDGTVKIINGYQPSPEELRGHTTIMPACLRPLTLDEELAPPPPSRAGRLLRAASHRLRRAIHSRSQRREEARLAALEAELEGEHAPPATIPEEENEGGSDESDDEEEEPKEPDSESDGDAPQDGGDDDNDGGKAEGLDGAEGDAGEGGERNGGRNERRGSKGGGSGNGGRGGSGQGGKGGKGGPRKDELRNFKQGKDALAMVPEINPGALDAILSKAQPGAQLSQRRSSCIISGPYLEGDEGYPLEESFSEPESPGAESLVEGMGPSWRHPLGMQVRQQPQVMGMPQLPRIRTRAQAAAPQAKATVASGSEPVDAQPWPNAGVKLNKTPPRQRGEDNMPEVFKRLTTSSKYGRLGVRVGGGGGSSSPTKKSGKAKSSSPFKKQSQGFRPTVLAPPPF